MNYFPTLVFIFFISVLYQEGALSAPKKYAKSKVNNSQSEFTDAILGRILPYLDPEDPNDVSLMLRSRNALGDGLGVRQRNRNWRRFATPQQQQSIAMLDYVANNRFFSRIENITLGEPVRHLRDIANNRYGTNFYLIDNACSGTNGNYKISDFLPESYLIVYHLTYNEPSSLRVGDFMGIDCRSPYYRWEYLELNINYNRVYGTRTLDHRAVFDSEGRFHPAGDLPLIRPILGLDQMGQHLVDYINRVKTFQLGNRFLSFKGVTLDIQHRKKLWYYIARLLNHPEPATHCCKPSQLGKRKRDDDPDDSMPPGHHLFHTLRSAWVEKPFYLVSYSKP